MSPSHPVNRHDELRALLERLNLGGMATVFADLALKAAKENLSHEAYLLELGKHEEELRTEARVPPDCCVLLVFPKEKRFARCISLSFRLNSSFRLSASKGETSCNLIPMSSWQANQASGKVISQRRWGMS